MQIIYFTISVKKKFCDIKLLVNVIISVFKEVQGDNVNQAQEAEAVNEPEDVIQEVDEAVEGDVIQGVEIPVDEVPVEQADDGDAPVGQVEAVGAVVPAAAPPQGGLGAAHQAMLLGAGPTGFQPYKTPSYFALKVNNCDVVKINEWKY